MPLDTRRSHIYSPDRLPTRENDSVFLGILLLLVLAVYFRVSQHGFINYDDPLYVTANRVVQAGLTVGGIRWTFTSFHAYTWHPLTWLSHMPDVQFFGVDLAWHHLVNLLFHLANTFLLYIVLKRMTGAGFTPTSPSSACSSPSSGGAGDLAERLRLGRKQFVPADIALFGALSVASFLQIGRWRDNITL